MDLRLSRGGAVRPLALAFAAVAGLALTTATHAATGRAQAGVSLGIYSTWDLDPNSSVTGTGYRDGVVVQTVDKVGDPPSGSIQVYDGLERVRIDMQAQGALLQAGGGDALPVAGMRQVESDLVAGTLRLKSQSGYVASPPPFPTRLAYVQAYTFAEMFQNFEVRWAKDHVGPVEVRLDVTVDGEVLQNDGSDGWLAGLGVYADLGNVATGLPPLAFPTPAPVVRYESGVANGHVSIGGSFINTQCFAVAGYCEAFVNLYVAFDMRGRNLEDGSTEFAKGNPHDFDFLGRLALTTSPGVEVLRVDGVGTVLPQYAWVNPAPVPEPESLMMVAVGLAGLGWRLRRRVAG
jgi:hypothetical protein